MRQIPPPFTNLCRGQRGFDGFAAGFKVRETDF